MIRRTKEGETTWFSDLEPSVLPFPLPSGIRIHLRREEFGIEVQGLVGAIPLLNGDTLQITPKIGNVNFFRLLFKAEGFQRDLEREYEEFVSYSFDADENVDLLVARQLIISIGEIVSLSPQVGRSTQRKSGVFAAGRIDAAATALRIAQRNPEPVVFDVKEKTVDIAENRIITEAVVRAWPMLSKLDQTRFGPVREKWMSRFPRSRAVSRDLEEIENRFAAGRYGGSRDYYRKALMLSQIILASNGLGFDDAATVQGDAILLNTPDVFERYLRNTISATYLKDGYVVAKGGVGATSLYTDGSFSLEPDIVVSKDGQPLLILDAKYKSPAASDHYQMHSYLKANGINRGLLLAPLFEGKTVVLKEYSTSDRTVVREAYLPMQDLEATEAFLSTVLQLFS